VFSIIFREQMMRKDLTKMKLQEQEFKQLFWELYPNIALYAARLVRENEVDVARASLSLEGLEELRRTFPVMRDGDVFIL